MFVEIRDEGTGESRGTDLYLQPLDLDLGGSREQHVRRKQPLGPSELILWLGSASMVWGPARLQREAFLLWKEHQDIVQDPEFDYRRLGPRSQLIADAIPVLKQQGYFEESLSWYRVTKAGHEYIQRRLREVGVSTEQIVEKKKSWDEFGVDGLTTYIYRIHPNLVTVPHT